MKTPLIIHHGHCPDGFGSAWHLGNHLGPHEKYAAGYNDTEWPDFESRDVYLVDFCYPATKLEEIAIVASQVLILDHHQSAIGYAKAATTYSYVFDVQAAIKMMEDWGIVACIDETHSGVGLVEEYVSAVFSTVQAAPEWFANLQDRDLWTFKTNPTAGLSEYTPAVFAAITARPYTDEAWDEMAAMPAWKLCDQGTGIEMYRQRLIESILETRHLITIDGHDVWACAAPYSVGSDVAGRLCELDPDRGFAAYYVVNDFYDHDLKFGLRSLPDGMDVAVIAENYPPGGGHKHASGFQITGLDEL